MRRPPLIRLLGFVLAGLVALSIGSRPQIRAAQAPTLIPAAAIGGAFGVRGTVDDHGEQNEVYIAQPPLTKAQLKVLLKLEEKISFNFPTESTLQDVKKYIEESTKDKVDFPDGLTIYIDPQGLQDADKSMASTVVFDLKGQPLEKSLRLLLRQLSLSFDVDKDGLLIITATIAQEESNIDKDRRILKNLMALRTEVSRLRQEIGQLRGHEIPPTPLPTPRGPDGPGGLR